jgi:para-aminobenzoate synthetase component 1
MVIRSVTDPQTFKVKALQWASSFDVCCYLDSNNFNDPYSKSDALIAAGVKDEIKASSGNAFAELERFRHKNAGWITGFFGYDLKNEQEHLVSCNTDHLNFPDLYFFAPLHLIIIKGNEMEIISDNAQEIFGGIGQQNINFKPEHTVINIQSRFTRSAYIDAVEKIKEHIKRGDIYVTNFCQEFFAENTVIDPLAVFSTLNQTSPNPFAAFFKLHDKYVLCASPERFLAKRGTQLIAQPIKGTAKRGKDDIEDETIKQEFRNQAKEQQENVMIVDLVRNDLTLSAKKGTVKTEEMFGIYSFKQLHHMISTITCELQHDVSAIDAVRNTFPMGSMTGAPKLRSMQLMEDIERSRRGTYSGSIGYFSPDDDFDFNVVIRTILYDQRSKYLSFQTGSAITWHADAKQEYEECLLKAKAIMEVLGCSSPKK